jgi:hypothetical protein
MLTGEIRSKIDAIWNTFWAGGIANPLDGTWDRQKFRHTQRRHKSCKSWHLFDHGPQCDRG